MDVEYQQLAAFLANAPNSLWVAVAGPPGAGKSTLTRQLVQLLQSHYAKQAAVIPMDGYHLYRAELDQLEDPAEAHRRRGAYWTFNAEKLVQDLGELKEVGEKKFPSFDHGVGDPVENDIWVSLKEHKVIIVEGNYLLLKTVSPWDKLFDMFDEKWFIMASTEVIRDRVVKRHVSTGKTLEEAQNRVEYNDLPNVNIILETVQYADRIIHSK